MLSTSKTTDFSPESLVDDLLSDEFAEHCSLATGIEAAAIKKRLIDYCGEIDVGLSLLKGRDLAGLRILEVGAGLGILSIILKRKGYDIVALEPGAGGFDDNAKIGQVIRSRYEAEDIPLLEIGAGNLDPQQHGLFSLIFSVNVLEHIPDLKEAVHGMRRVIEAGGMMIHTCPNYAVPYEPHFGIPLFPGVPALTRLVVPTIAQHPVWKSLNFITAARMRAICRHSGLAMRLYPGTIYRSFVRIEEDPVFRARHVTLAKVTTILRRVGILSLLKRWPASLSSPMIFECWPI